MKKLGVLCLIMGFFFLYSSVFADTVTEVTTRVNKVQTDDTSLPNPATGLDKKGFVGEIIARIFDAQGKILSSFIYALQGLTAGDQDTVMKWNGAALAPTNIVDKSGKIGIGNPNPNEALEVTGNIKASGNVISITPTEPTHLATKEYVDSRIVTAEGGVDMKYYQLPLTTTGWNQARCPEGYSIITCDDIRQYNTWYAGWYTYSAIWPDGSCNVYGHTAYTGDRMLLVCMVIPGLLVNGNHNEDDCIAAGGTVYDITSRTKICQFNTPYCPAGWSQYENWSTTSNTPSPGAIAADFLNPFTYKSTPKCAYQEHPEGWDRIDAYTPCTPTASHTWGNNAVEQCTAQITGKYTWCDTRVFGICVDYDSAIGPVNTLCHNGRTQIGCY